MAQGRPPNPLRLVTETGHRPIPVPATIDPTPLDAPEGLPEDALGMWDYLTGVLQKAGILENTDRYALELTCRTYAEYLTAKRAYDAEPIVEGSQGQAVKSPYWQIMNAARAELRKELTEFGLTPAARVRIGALQKGGEGLGQGLEAVLAG
jgi:P27 family predicted phage terminase small subunit